jgi:hypothetical protein
MSEISTADIDAFLGRPGFQYESLWKVYIALKSAFTLGQQGYTSDGPLRDLLRAANTIPDYRIAPMLSSLWSIVGGNAPAELEVSVMSTSVRIRSGSTSISVVELLADIQETLVRNGQTLWLLFDKIDEIHPTKPRMRREALEALFPACMYVNRAFPAIVPRVFIRSDLFNERLRFTNKDHLRDKRFDIEWESASLQSFLVKRAMTPPAVANYIRERLPGVTLADIERVPDPQVANAFYRIFEERAYKGPREAKLLKWVIDRATDASGSAFPRDLISYGNIAKEKQGKKGVPDGDFLVTGGAMVEAYYDVSRNRYHDVLVGEFPELVQHFLRFRGRHDSPYQRAELLEMFSDLSPSGTDALEALSDAGVLRPTGNRDVAVAYGFDVPRLYRAGLGLRIHGRP